jgi:riboflavin transporter FmnP
VLTLLATVLYFIEVPIFGGYLKLDFSDIPALLAGVMFGPSSGIAVELIKNLIHLGIRGLGDTFGYGNLMNFIVGTAAVVPYSAVMRAGLRKDVSMGKISYSAGAAGMAAMVVGGQSIGELSHRAAVFRRGDARDAVRARRCGRPWGPRRCSTR